jgi:hypothetical protein
MRHLFIVIALCAQVTEKLRTRYIQFDGEYDINSESCFNRWLQEDRGTPLGCEAWVDQKPRQLTLYVRYKGRVIFSDEINGYLVDYAKPYKGATFSNRLYTSDLGSGCRPGVYYWQMVLGDPLQRRGGGARASSTASRSPATAESFPIQRRAQSRSRHLGQSSLDVTSGVYGHFEKATRRREAEAMAGVFGV